MEIESYSKPWCGSLSLEVEMDIEEKNGGESDTPRIHATTLKVIVRMTRNCNKLWSLVIIPLYVDLNLELQRNKLLLSYKDMVGIVKDMINVSRSMKCFCKGSNNSPLLQFSYNSEEQSDFGDDGDGGGIPVSAFLSITSHEKFAEELVQMFSLELCLKRLLVLEFMSIGCDTSQVKQLHWSTQLYADEFKDLRECNLYCEVTHGPLPPRLRDGKSDMVALRFDNQPDPEVLQVYLTTWLAEVNIDTLRVNEIFAVIGEEMHVSIC